ncbi:hypothetical protein CVU75_03490 [Candidatus Dependentiae bacterium HGW-Dependentiae-1]|nr:MAG: hypothetical protein CVU75_03490 [Candidatus Dependentiae bacterium HGW-Dependentiae-1]
MTIKIHLSLLFATGLLMLPLAAMDSATELQKNLATLDSTHRAIQEHKTAIHKALSATQNLEDAEESVSPHLGKLSDTLTVATQSLQLPQDKAQLDELLNSMAEFYLFEDITPETYRANIATFFAKLEEFLQNVKITLQEKIAQIAPPAQEQKPQSLQQAKQQAIKNKIANIRSNFNKLKGQLEGIANMPAFLWQQDTVGASRNQTLTSFRINVLNRLSEVAVDETDQETLQSIRENELSCLYHPADDPFNRRRGDVKRLFDALDSFIDTLERKAAQ